MPSNEQESDRPLANGVCEAKTSIEPQKAGTDYHRDGLKPLSSLGLSADKFIIDYGSSPSIKVYHNRFLPQSESLRVSEISLKSRSTRTSFGNLADIKRRSEMCPFCYLVIQSILPLNPISTYGSAKCYINWELDGRTASRDGDGRVNSRTRRIHLVWDDGRLKDAYLVFMAPERYSRPNSDARRVWGDEALFLGRTIDTEKGNQALIKSWLDLCYKTHQGPCRDDATMPVSTEFSDIVSQSYFGVVDVLDMQLTSLPVIHFDTAEYGSRTRSRKVRHRPYIALSYVWGEGKPYTTNLSNVMLHRSHGGLEKNLEDLPLVFHDAFNLVRCLGVRYIWIDSLCIVQDSNRSWCLNSRIMDLIYGNALLTICAADGTDSSTGLRAMHPKGHDVCQASADCAPGVRLMVSQPPEIGIRASQWNTRAWTFQERLASKRCLIFTEGRVYFQCLSTGMSEDVFADREGAGWSLELTNAPLQMLRELSRRALWVYTNCVSLYTTRILTKRKDILAAFTGISNLIEKTMQAPFIFGLPSSHFDIALLWQPQSAMERRVPNTDKERIEYSGLQFPSWSWCGWTSDAPSSHMQEGSDYKAVMVDDCLPNVREWLTNHTWIQWYIRDGHGNLRPLWHREKSTEDSSSETRWRGYMSHQERKISDDSSRDSSGEYCRVSFRRDRNDRDGGFDDYGRQIPKVSEIREPRSFFLTLPENPYRVVMADYSTQPDGEFPDQPILQFWTWYTSLHLIPSEHPGPKSPKGLCRCDIADEIGDWCGSLVLNKEWLINSQLSKHEFIAISEAKAFTKDECDIWSYYIPKERERSEWDLYYVLLLERKDSMRWERVALGKVFQAAFVNADWKEMILG